MDIHAENNLGYGLDFTYSEGSGAVGGPGAPLVRRMIELWDGVGVLYGTQYERAPDPRGSLRDLAIMLATAGWELEGQAAAALPPPQPVPDRAVA